ncbi:hypothetical protein EXIGLDRAFT_718473 [Exidia glandulosa HHB12029]|uniref:Uncharacterized protein n=1 Tax=Exidia glandulosa HHB12029 TaxID=1314781 RepID=A0A165NWV1_EXIGL|nr:hypothetical protein EXIGLDRAFT_718473 [Exidia glandulosa HHB12029]
MLAHARLALLLVLIVTAHAAVVIRPDPELLIRPEQHPVAVHLPPAPSTPISSVDRHKSKSAQRTRVWKCSSLDRDEFPLDAKRSNVLGDSVLICAYPSRLDEGAFGGSYCTYDLRTGELVGDYNAGFCPSSAV